MKLFVSITFLQIIPLRPATSAPSLSLSLSLVPSFSSIYFYVRA